MASEAFGRSEGPAVDGAITRAAAPESLSRRLSILMSVAVARSTDRPTGNGKQEKDATPY